MDSRFLGSTRSILLSTSSLYTFLWLISSTMLRSWGPMAVTSTSTSRASMPSMASSMDCTMNSPSFVRGRWMPGVSTNTIWQLSPPITPITRLRVVWGRLDTIATFSPTRVFSSVDLPTLGRPTMVAKPEWKFLFSDIEVPF